MSIQHSPEYYAQLAMEAEKRGHWREAETQWYNGKGACIGHNRAERYRSAAQRANYNRAVVLAKMQRADSRDAFIFALARKGSIPAA